MIYQSLLQYITNKYILHDKPSKNYPFPALMTDISYNKWSAMSDDALAAHIGAFVKHHRLARNKSQEAIAHAAGISRSTLSLLERGQTVTVATLIQVLRVLDLLYTMEAFTVPTLISPLAIAKLEQTKRIRARPSDTGSKAPQGKKRNTDW
ncbi:helix-turn-helix domain-containing protein [Hymenobacter sp. 102]|uniref:helix-turn-helix domain-containing protein n=1 Tax=Hymenobacter sp. 102 TaxID=3403152 RepID=UPI003CF790E4